MTYSERAARSNDFDFLFELKKAAEYEAVSRVFGWDESLQRHLHEVEWSQAKPTIIEIDGKRIGSYLLKPQDGGYYFGRFFLLPDYQGKGIGSAVIKDCIGKAKSQPITLCYLVGNQVHSLYERHGFRVTHQDEHFVHMCN
ncbi:GNAT family N-acetyltransferase [Vibrio mediterranei]|uniref:GNAT family N-acetyltransferase n=1 Tax=Vibrio mediterranei TaxID=689 RepID=UPI00148CE19A|nr:GNAT family N-acetyltransferase [Vibrio mediterranei]NOH31751.1 GNAT family N-acetyltransferase [Vibrio mediterranei]